ncbi:MAG TPA: hypothetical protein VN918_08215 [Myxococcaceae bacterium]|nr:hypothetical protein [Myxococcaceae bacterium]
MNKVEQIEVLVLATAAEDLEIYIETDEELRQTYKRMTQEEILAELDEPLTEIDVDRACLSLDGGTQVPIYWLRVSKDSDGSLDWDFQLAAVIEAESVNPEEKPCTQLT